MWLIASLVRRLRGFKRLQHINTGVTAAAAPLLFPDKELEWDAIFHPKPTLAGDLEAKSIANWRRLYGPERAALVDHLRKAVLKFDDGNDVLARWAQQKRDGLRIGSDEFNFHFGNGMWVRNVLRELLPDDCLPDVIYDGGKKFRNWDDFYHGALDELAGQS